MSDAVLRRFIFDSANFLLRLGRGKVRLVQQLVLKQLFGALNLDIAGKSLVRKEFQVTLQSSSWIHWGSRWIASLASGELTVLYTEAGGVAVIAPNLAPVYRSSTFAAICA